MIYFPDTTLQRYTFTKTGTGVYGEDIKTYEYADDILCDFQNESNNEIAHSYGIELKDLYKIYVDLSVTINASDMLVDTAGNKYDIIGSIMCYKKFHHYKKIHLVKRR